MKITILLLTIASLCILSGCGMHYFNTDRAYPSFCAIPSEIETMVLLPLVETGLSELPKAIADHLADQHRYRYIGLKEFQEMRLSKSLPVLAATDTLIEPLEGLGLTKAATLRLHNAHYTVKQDSSRLQWERTVIGEHPVGWLYLNAGLVLTLDIRDVDRKRTICSRQVSSNLHDSVDVAMKLDPLLLDGYLSKLIADMGDQVQRCILPQLQSGALIWKDISDIPEVAQAYAQADSGHWTRAVPLLEGAVLQHPGNPDLRLDLGTAYEMAHRFACAEALYQAMATLTRDRDWQNRRAEASRMTDLHRAIDPPTAKGLDASPCATLPPFPTAAK